MTHRCRLCGTPFEPPASAPHKKFCSIAHRDEWHRQERERRKRDAGPPPQAPWEAEGADAPPRQD